MMRNIYWLSLLLLCCSLAISFPGCTTTEITEEWIDSLLTSFGSHAKVDKERLNQEPEYITLSEELKSASNAWYAKKNELENFAEERNIKLKRIDGKLTNVTTSPKHKNALESHNKKYEELHARWIKAKSKKEAYEERKLKEYKEERRRAKVQPLLNKDPEYQKLVKEISLAEVMISNAKSQEERQKWEAKVEQLKSKEEEIVEQKWKIYIKEKNSELLNPEKEGNGGNGGNGGY